MLPEEYTNVIPDSNHYFWEEYENIYLGFLPWDADTYLQSQWGFSAVFIEKKSFNVYRFLPEWEIFQKNGDFYPLPMNWGIIRVHPPVDFSTARFVINTDDKKVTVYEPEYVMGDKNIYPTIEQRVSLEKIPLSLRKLVAGFPSAQWVVLDAVKLIPEMEEFLRLDLQNNKQNYLIFLWKMAGIHLRDTEQRISLHKKIMHRKRALLMEEFLGIRIAPGFLNVFGRIMPPVYRNDAIRLLTLLDDPLRGKILRHQKNLSIHFLEILSALPDWMATPAVVEALLEAQEKQLDLKTIIPPSLMNIPKELDNPQYRNSIFHSFQKIKSLSHLERQIHRWTQKISLDIHFPDPPLGSSNLLSPIWDGRSLHREGQYMQNCVAGYAPDILDGRCYFYHWYKKPKSYASVLYVLDVEEAEWVLDEMLGFDNKHLSVKTATNIFRESARIHPQKRLFLGRFHVVGTQYYDAKKTIREITGKETVSFLREPKNSYDKKAVALYYKTLKLGYIPSGNNTILAMLLDAKAEISGVLADVRIKSRGITAIDVLAYLIHRDS